MLAPWRLSLVATLLLAACGSGGGSSGSTPVATIEGKAIKGPFLKGSSVIATQLGGTGQVSATVLDDQGNYSVQIPWPGATLITVNGRYTDEFANQTALNTAAVSVVVDAVTGTKTVGQANLATSVAATLIQQTITAQPPTGQTIAEQTANVAQAISQLVGATAPVRDLAAIDLTKSDSNAAQLLAFQLAVLAAMPSSTTLSQVITQLAQNIRTGQVLGAPASGLTGVQRQQVLDQVAQIRNAGSLTLLSTGEKVALDRVLAGLAAWAGSSPSIAMVQAAVGASGIFVPTGKMSTARTRHAATLLPSGKVLVSGGISIDLGLITSAELYDPAIERWSVTGSMLTARQGHTATLLATGKVLVAGGTTSTAAELYDPTTGTWTSTGSMGHDSTFLTTTLLSTGKVLAVEGLVREPESHNGPGTVSSAELYDPAAGAWTPTAAPIDGRSSFTATALTSGRVLVAGGQTTFFSILAPNHGMLIDALVGAELYDPTIGTWSETGRMVTARSRHTATLLSNGMVLVAGGEEVASSSNLSQGIVPVKEAELYLP